MSMNHHTAAFRNAALLLGLFALAGCSRLPSGGDVNPDGPAQASLSVTLADYSSSQPFTKASYSDSDVLYTHERIVEDCALYLFDASDAFVDNGQGQKVFDPARAKQITSGKSAAFTRTDLGNGRLRVDFSLDKPCTSLAVLMLANFGDLLYNVSSIPGKGTSLQEMIDWFSFTTDPTGLEVRSQADYLAHGIPMHGFGLYDQIRHLQGTTTQLQGDLVLTYALCRLRIRCDAAFTQAGLLGAELLGSRRRMRVLPVGFPSAPATPFDSVSDIGSQDNIAFVPAGDGSLIAYVPELNTGAAQPEPSLRVSIQEGNRTITYAKNLISVTEGGSTISYGDPAATAWTRMISLAASPDGQHPAGTRFNLVRHFTYEWIATGLTNQ